MLSVFLFAFPLAGYKGDLAGEYYCATGILRVLLFTETG